jgi:preprotein translocase subunit SecG
MSILLVVIHVIVCVALIMIVLLQTGKGTDMGAAFGGGSSQTLFGSGGASTFLSKATTVAAIVFMLTSLTLAYITGGKTVKSVVSDVPLPAVQQQQTEQTQTQSNPAAGTDAQSETEAGTDTDAGTDAE